MLELIFFAIFLLIGAILRGCWLQPIITHLQRERDELQKQIDRMWEGQQKEIVNICKLESLLKRAKAQRDALREKLAVFQEAAERGLL